MVGAATPTYHQHVMALSYSQLRRFDRWVGIPVVAALTVHRRLLRRRTPSGPPRRGIVVVKLAEQGATVVAVEAFERVAESLQRIDRELLALASAAADVHRDEARGIVLGLYATLDEKP